MSAMILSIQTTLTPSLSVYICTTNHYYYYSSLCQFTELDMITFLSFVIIMRMGLYNDSDKYLLCIATKQFVVSDQKERLLLSYKQRSQISNQFLFVFAYFCLQICSTIYEFRNSFSKYNCHCIKKIHDKWHILIWKHTTGSIILYKHHLSSSWIRENIRIILRWKRERISCLQEEEFHYREEVGTSAQFYPT